MISPDLKRYDNSWYDPGRSRLVQAVWFFLGLPVLRSPLLPFSGLRGRLLRLFGASIGVGVVIKPGVRVKYPWLLEVGDHTWVGEDAWIDNLAPVRIGSNVCISQGVYLCTGNHDWADPCFSLMVRTISIADGAWIGARAMLLPGVEVGECAVAAAGSVVTRNLNARMIYGGNPAVELKARKMREVTDDEHSHRP
jgi:putative colanic acid biosynthesis acetyltransferase WcaF